MSKITAEEFVDKIDELCFEYKYELIPTVTTDNVPFISVQGDDDSARVWYIDGDGRGK